MRFPLSVATMEHSSMQAMQNKAAAVWDCGAYLRCQFAAGDFHNILSHFSLSQHIPAMRRMSKSRVIPASSACFGGCVLVQFHAVRDSAASDLLLSRSLRLFLSGLRLSLLLSYEVMHILRSFSVRHSGHGGAITLHTPLYSPHHQCPRAPGLLPFYTLL